jgi:thioesterase domain-containing protein
MADSNLVEQLTELWQRVLKRPVVGTDQTFFELGGEPNSADDLFREIKKTLGQELSPVMIYHAPTISTLARLLAAPKEFQKCPPVLLVRSGGDPAVFLAHGIGADAMQLFHVAKHIQVSNAIYATQAPGVDSLQQPLNRIESMADRYLAAMKSLQPQGPYFLIGYSFGGLVMMEIAQRLVAEGQTIGLLAMLDSYPHRSHLSPGQHFLLLIQLASRRLFSDESAARKRTASFVHNANESEPHSMLKRVRRQIYNGELLALKHYEPRFYPGEIHFVRAKVPSCFPKNPDKVWKSLVSQFELETAPGDHADMVDIHYQAVAHLLTQYLRRALAKNETRSIHL